VRGTCLGDMLSPYPPGLQSNSFLVVCLLLQYHRFHKKFIYSFIQYLYSILMLSPEG
jgi:hypothetical protein